MSEEKIKTRADGSIDTAYYMERSRKIRSEEAHGIFKGLGGGISTLPDTIFLMIGQTIRKIHPWLSNWKSRIQ